MMIEDYNDYDRYKKEELTGVEPVTPRFAVSCSTAELQLLTELLGAYRFLHSSRSRRDVKRVFVGIGG